MGRGREDGNLGWSVCAVWKYPLNLLLLTLNLLALSSEPSLGLDGLWGRVHPTISAPCKEGDTAPLLSARSYPLSVLQRFVEWVKILLLSVT